MNLFLSILNLTLVIIGMSTIVRYLIFKLCEGSKKDYDYITVLKDNNAEMVLRDIIAKNKYEFDAHTKRIFAVDGGLDEETRAVCEYISLTNPQIVFLSPNDLPELLR